MNRYLLVVTPGIEKLLYKEVQTLVPRLQTLGKPDDGRVAALHDEPFLRFTVQQTVRGLESFPERREKPVSRPQTNGIYLTHGVFSLCLRISDPPRSGHPSG